MNNNDDDNNNNNNNKFYESEKFFRVLIIKRNTIIDSCFANFIHTISYCCSEILNIKKL
jgi:hypothetical protein